MDGGATIISNKYQFAAEIQDLAGYEHTKQCVIAWYSGKYIKSHDWTPRHLHGRICGRIPALALQASNKYQGVYLRHSPPLPY